jgi:UDP-N-acetylmuramyl tripeptide synthase
VVLIAGKGPEKYQEMEGRVLPFDDVAVAGEGLKARRLRSRIG